MTTETFTLNTREEVARFEQLLDDYVSSKADFSLDHISLVTAYDKLQTRSDGGRIFTALLDIQINFLLLYIDRNTVGQIWAALFSKGKLEGGSVLDSPEKFFGKMDIHHFNTAYILRYRAIWDKLMGLIILIEAPDDYDSFSQAKSKRRTFAKIAEKCRFSEAPLLADLDDVLTRFDNKFRTSEMHGTGVLRKYSFAMESMGKNPQVELIGFWNAINSFIFELGKIFTDSSTLTVRALRRPAFK